MDWTGIIRELGTLAINIQTDRFYAIYLLIAVFVVLWWVRKI